MIVLSWPWHVDKFTIKVHILIVAIKSTLSQNSKIAQLNMSVHPYWKSMLAGLWWSLSHVEKIWRKWALKVIVTAILASTIQILLPTPLSPALLKVTMSVSISSLSAVRELSAFHWQPNLTYSDQYRKAVLLFHYVLLWKETKERGLDRKKEMTGRPNHEMFRIRFI